MSEDLLMNDESDEELQWDLSSHDVNEQCDIIRCATKQDYGA